MQDDIKYFEEAGMETLKEYVGDDALMFYYWSSGEMVVHKEEEHDFEGKTYFMQFMFHIKRESHDAFDAEQFGKEMMERHSWQYRNRCGCAHDCCGHVFTANLDIHVKSWQNSLSWLPDDNGDPVRLDEPAETQMYEILAVVHNGINL